MQACMRLGMLNLLTARNIYALLYAILVAHAVCKCTSDNIFMILLSHLTQLGLVVDDMGAYHQRYRITILVTTIPHHRNKY